MRHAQGSKRAASLWDHDLSCTISPAALVHGEVTFECPWSSRIKAHHMLLTCRPPHRSPSLLLLMAASSVSQWLSPKMAKSESAAEPLMLIGIPAAETSRCILGSDPAAIGYNMTYGVEIVARPEAPEQATLCSSMHCSRAVALGSLSARQRTTKASDHHWMDRHLENTEDRTFDGHIHNAPFTPEGDTALARLENELVHIEGGSFMMGCARMQEQQKCACGDDDQPTHRVSVGSFFLSKYEVTQALWMAVMGSNPSLDQGSPRKPVERVSWNNAQTFIGRLNALTGEHYRLPTEAEWEYAARGGDYGRNTIYAGSDDLGSVAWYADNSGGETHPVGLKTPNELGLYDMNGNVQEWCSDHYDKAYYSRCPSNDPPGPLSGQFRVLRGGSCYSGPCQCRPENRYRHLPEHRYFLFGFRLAKDA